MKSERIALRALPVVDELLKQSVLEPTVREVLERTNAFSVRLDDALPKRRLR